MKKSMFTGFSHALETMGAEGAVQHAKSLGFDGVEPFPGKAMDTVEQARELKRALESAGMDASCFSRGATLIGPDADETVRHLMHCADLAAECGSPFLHHTLILGLSPLSAGAPSFDEALSEIIPRAQAVADYAASIGITCLYEDQGFYVNGCERFERFFTSVDRENTGVCFDFGNILFVGETPESFIGRFSNVVRHVHVKDYLFKSGSTAHPGDGWLLTRDGDFLRDTIPGHGIVNFVQCMRILKSSGYTGYYSFEFGGPEPYESGVRAAMANMERYMEQASIGGAMGMLNLPAVD